MWQVGEYVTEGEKPFDQGSFGTVWRARRGSDDARVALKLVLLTDAPDSHDRIAAERHGALLQQRFQEAHGLVPRVYEYGYDGDGNLFIAMELIQGGALADLIKAGPMAPELAARHAVQICEFLEKAHGFATVVEGEPYDKLVHADLKPGHVLIGSGGDIKILDFGIAKALAKTTQVTTNNWGTSAYASPERLDEGHVNEHVDFWSLGVILYEMVAGHRPYPALDRNRSQLEAAIRSNAPREPLPPSCPADLAAIIDKLLAYQPERRYGNAAAIKEDLDLFLVGKTPGATAEYATVATMPIRQSTTHRLRAAAVLAVPPTDPLPAPSGLPSVGPAKETYEALPSVARSAKEGAWPPRTRLARVLRSARWLAAAGVMLMAFFVLSSEAAGWFAAARFRATLPTIEGSTLGESRAAYDRIRQMSPFHIGLRLLVRQPLRERLTTLADAVIADYRREEPSMGPAEWRQAQDALRWAVQFAPASTALLGKLRTCEAHVIRISARTQTASAARTTYRRAVERFREAAALDVQSFDPYLGISRVAVYGLGDLDAATTAIQDAEKRGYEPGRRERALLGDGFLRRANTSRLLARTLSGEQHRRELEKARADYASCIDAFDPIVGFGFAAKNLEICKRQLDLVGRELGEYEEIPIGDR
jgi:eukaryotic-like serine/threonine-protein kinase